MIDLHTSARIGARRLVGVWLTKDRAWGILRGNVQESLRPLSPTRPEDVLCIYNGGLLLSVQEFLPLRSGGGRGGCVGRIESRPELLTG